MVSGNFTNRKIRRLRDLLSRNYPLDHNCHQIRAGPSANFRAKISPKLGYPWAEF